MQLSGHLVDSNNKKMAGPTISGNFDGTLTAHLEDGSQRKLWEKQYPPTGPGRYSSSSGIEAQITQQSWAYSGMLSVTERGGNRRHLQGSRPICEAIACLNLLT